MSVDSKRFSATEELLACSFCQKRTEDGLARDGLERSGESSLAPSGEYSRTSAACEVCQDGNGKTDAAISELHCSDCHQNLCVQCARLHRNFNATRHHCITPVRQQKSGMLELTQPPPPQGDLPTSPVPATNQVNQAPHQMSQANKRSIKGMAVLSNRLYMVSHKSSEVEVYSTDDLKFKGRWMVNGLVHPVDIAACRTNSCLYICDWRTTPRSELVRIDRNGNARFSWSTGRDMGALSVSDGLIVMTVTRANKLNEYAADGVLVNELQFRPDTGIRSPTHAVRLFGDYVVAHGDDGEALHRVCVVSAAGELLRSFGGTRGAVLGQLRNPRYLAVGTAGTGDVLVADECNRRVLLLTADLEFEAEFVGREAGLRYPRSVHFDQHGGRVFVADNDWAPFTGWNSGRVLGLGFKSSCQPRRRELLEKGPMRKSAAMLFGNEPYP